MPVYVISSPLDSGRQGKSAQFVRNYGWFADQHSVRPQERNDKWRQVVGKCLARRDIAIPGIEMSERHAAGKEPLGGPQPLAHIAEQEELGRRNTIGMSCNGTLADKNVAIREELSKMVIGSAVAETELEHFTVQTGDQIGGQFEAGALCLEPADDAIQPTHRHHAAMPAVLRKRSTSARAARS